MCNNCPSTVLLESAKVHVNYCNTCKYFTLAFHGSCAFFLYHELESFQNLLSELREEDYCPDIQGNRLAVLKDPMQAVGLRISKRQVAELLFAIVEAKLQYKVNYLLRH